MIPKHISMIRFSALQTHRLLSLACHALFLGSIVFSHAADDEVSGTGYVFDPKLNIVRETDPPHSYLQDINAGTHVFLEARNFLTVWNLPDIEWTRQPPAWPLWSWSVVCKAGPSNLENESALKTADPILPKVTGEHNLWIRWVRWKKLPAPLTIRVLQNGKVVCEKTIGTENSDNPDPHQAIVLWEPVKVSLEANQPTVIEFVKKPDESLAGDRILDAIYLTSDPSYRPVGRIQLNDGETVKARAASLQKAVNGNGKIALWPSASPWVPFGIHDAPMAYQIASELTLEACQNEIEQALIFATSLAQTDLDYTMEVSNFVSSEGKPFAAPEVRIAAQLKSLRYDWVPLPLFKRERLHLAPFHTTGLWIKVNTAGMPPGNYSSELRLTSSDGEPVTFKIHLTVRDLKLTPSDAFWVSVWTSSLFDKPEQNPGVIADLREHGVNFLRLGNPTKHEASPTWGQQFVGGTAVTLPWAYFQLRKNEKEKAADGFAADDEKRLPHAFYLKQQVRWDEKADAPILEKALSEVAQVRKETGFQDKPFIAQFGDEFGPSEYWRDIFEASKRIAPGLLTYMNPVWLNAEGVKLMNGSVDVWMPNEHNLVSKTLLEAMKASRGHSSYYYQMTADGPNPVKPWMQFRKMAWLAIAKELGGMAFFAYDFYDGNPWSDGKDGVLDGGPGQYAVVYPGNNGPIPTPNWEAWREGVEDASLLLMAKKISNSPEVPIAKRLKLARTVEFSVSRILEATDPEQYVAEKKRIVDAIIACKSGATQQR